MLVLTGPQGSGNHMWSKIFALHPQVSGWSALLDTYWIGHDHEPFADCWTDPTLLLKRNWGTYNFYVTSISVPYMNNGTPTVPDFKGFVSGVQNLGYRVKLAVIGRDKNILEHQETRVRGGITLEQAVAEYSKFAQPAFLSYELLHLYGRQYLQKIERELEFPIAWDSPEIDNILREDTNAKYFNQITHQPTDDLARHASRKKR